MVSAWDLVGSLGSIAVITAYFSDQQQWVSSRGWPYLVTNLVGSLLIALSLLHNWNLPAMMIEVFWILISLYGMLRRLSGSDRP